MKLRRIEITNHSRIKDLKDLKVHRDRKVRKAWAAAGDLAKR